MAKMIPADCSDATLSTAEKNLFYKFENSFDNTWTIFHSFNLMARNRDKKLVDVEIDFLLFHSDYGILVLEVKGGKIAVKDGQWYQYKKILKTEPEKQARQNKYAIKSYLTDYLHATPPLPFGHAICFPDYFGEADEFPPNYRDITITGKAVDSLQNEITRIMKDYIKGDYQPIDRRMHKTILTALMPVFEYGSSLIDKIGQEEREIFTLTESQCELLDFILKHKKALVLGCAGSGKTIMAVKKAKQLAKEGKSVLLLCYNNMLGDKLAEDVKEFKNIFATTYHKYCIKILEVAGIKIEPDGKGDEFWTVEIPSLFLKYIEKNPIKYDAVIVDEGQDFREEYWISISDLIEDDNYYYIFYDPDQNLFGTRLQLPKLSAPFTLNKNCRNSRTIFDRMKQYSTTDMKIMNQSPEGMQINEYQSRDPVKRRKQLSKILHDLVMNQNLSEDKIVILGGHRLSKTCIGSNTKIGRFIIEENGVADKGVVPYYTYMKFKGLDSDVVILLDVSQKDKRWATDIAMYTAVSRAKHLLYIIKIN